MINEEEVWLQREGETHKAYEAFEVYLNLGTERSNRATAKRIGKSVQLIDRWSSRHEWVKRARAWDNHNTRLFQESYDNATVEIARRQARIGRTLQSVGMKHVEGLELRDELMNYTNAVATVRTGVDIERVAMNQATQIVSSDVKMSVSNIEEQSTEELLNRVKHLLEDRNDE